MGDLLAFPQHRITVRAPVERTEVVRQAMFLLSKIGDEGVKATRGGFLPKELTLAFWREFLSDREPEPQRESDSIELYRLNFLLTEARYLRRREGAIHLTKKAAAVRPADLYRDLADAMLFEYNWAYDDRFEEHPEIQRGSLEFLEWIAEGGHEPVTARQVFDAHFESYLLRENKFTDKRKREWAEEPVECLRVRLFERFAVPFGLMTGPGENGEYIPTDLLLRHFFDLVSEKL